MAIRHLSYGPDAGPVSPSTLRDLYCAAFTVVGVLLGAWVIAVLAGDAGAYYCAPTVPWRIEIALFGSFALDLLARMARARGLAAVTYPFTLLALFWIAPFYGYFSGPVFLGISMIADCAKRSVVQLCIAALGMAAEKSLGSTLASSLLKQP